ncbi:hypothetical protein C0992_011213 [Termitomyces sp. T32_za158]|nr:hypothetical protein C0992_011213 [Termitomyces sp. T32_za158]
MLAMTGKEQLTLPGEKASQSDSEANRKRIVSQATLIKMDVRLMPVLAGIYLLSYLDRTNIGNARIAGLQQDLELTNTQGVGPDRVLPTMLTLWGTVATLQASLSGAFGGLLAYGVLKMDGMGGKPGWAWLFFLEGIVSVLFGLLSFFLLPHSLERTFFLSQPEREAILSQLRYEGTLDEEADSFNTKEIGRALVLPHVLCIATIYLLAGIILAFTPTILLALGYAETRAQLMSVPPFAAGFVVTIIASAISDKYGHRGASALTSSVLCIIGFIMYLCSKNPHVRYASLFISIAGINSQGPALAAWLSNNAAPQTRRATAIAFGFIMTNVGAIIALWLFSAWSRPPRYTEGTIVLLVASCVMAVLCVCNLLYLYDQNRKKAVSRSKIVRTDEAPCLGDRSAWFIYAL